MPWDTAPSGLALLAGLLVVSPVAAADPYADTVLAYEPGIDPWPGYTDPSTALGPPTRYTGEGFDPMIVSVFNPAWRPDEIVSLGAGGYLVLKFDTPVTDDPLNPFGIDLLVFGNGHFEDGWPLDGTCTDPAYCFHEGGIVELSPDGQTWALATDVEADGMFPTEGYLDRTDAYDPEPGLVESNFTRPVDPAITLSDFDGLPYEQVLELYRGSGGGAGIDLAPLGLTEISFVRISNPADSDQTPEIDAVADVSPRLPGDANLDGIVNIDDVFEVLARWGPARPDGWDAEFTGDGVVNIDDLFIVLANWSL
ncbi:MAG: hypothetical protein JSV91_00845 [Phycisphaerales bacterium]|nr:MAG: hypothetical protein JSV91_00845 [Phycisphaerales bacterium]